MTEQTTPPRDNSLYFFDLGRAGMAALFRNFFPFLQITAIPLVLNFVLRIANQIFAPAEMAPFTQLLADRFSSTLFAMAWLGFLLLPAGSRRHWLPRWSADHFVFLGYALLIAALQVVLTQAGEAFRTAYLEPFGTPPLVLIVILGLPVDYIHCCLGLAFCALAVGQPGGPLWSWRMIGWSALKMVVIITLAAFFFTFVGSFIGRFVAGLSAGLGYAPLLAAFPPAIANYAAYALTLGIFAFAFRELTGWPRTRDEKISEVFE